MNEWEPTELKNLKWFTPKDGKCYVRCKGKPLAEIKKCRVYVGGIPPAFCKGWRLYAWLFIQRIRGRSVEIRGDE